MVKSGLVDIPHVSHLRLAAHLSLAFVIFCIVLNEYLQLQFTQSNTKVPYLKKTIRIGFALIGIRLFMVHSPRVCMLDIITRPTQKWDRIGYLKRH